MVLERLSGKSAQGLPFSHVPAGGNLQSEDPVLLVEPDIPGIFTPLEVETAGSGNQHSTHPDLLFTDQGERHPLLCSRSRDEYGEGYGSLRFQER